MFLYEKEEKKSLFNLQKSVFSLGSCRLEPIEGSFYDSSIYPPPFTMLCTVSFKNVYKIIVPCIHTEGLIPAY